MSDIRNIGCPKFVWRLKYIHSVKDQLFHLTRLPAHEVEQNHLSPREYIPNFHTHKHLSSYRTFKLTWRKHQRCPLSWMIQYHVNNCKLRIHQPCTVSSWVNDHVKSAYRLRNVRRRKAFTPFWAIWCNLRYVLLYKIILFKYFSDFKEW